jgi:hypothetical protein
VICRVVIEFNVSIIRRVVCIDKIAVIADTKIKILHFSIVRVAEGGFSGLRKNDIICYACASTVYISDTLTINPKTTVTHDLYVQKSASTYNSDNKQDGKIYYTVTAYTTAGTESTVDIADTISNATYDQGSFVITGPNGTVDQSVYPVYITEKTFKILYLPQLAAGEQYVVKYSATPYWGGITDSKMKVDNSVTATSKSDTYTATSEINLTLLKKSCSYDSKSGKITWTIDVNPAHADLNGYTLSDTLTNPDGTTTEITENVTVSPAISGSSTIQLPYTFTESDTNEYKITYTTATDTTSVGTKNYSNSATLTNGSETHTTSSSVGAVGTGNITKNFVSESPMEGKDGARYTWTSTLTVPAAGITEQYYYNDYLDNQSGKLLITADTANIVVKGVDSSGVETQLVEGTDYSVNLFYYNSSKRDYTESYSDLQALKNAGGKATTFRIDFLKPISKSTYSKITVTYVVCEIEHQHLLYGRGAAAPAGHRYGAAHHA